MTDKQIVEDFLHFLNTHKGYIVTDTGADQIRNDVSLLIGELRRYGCRREK